MKNRSNRLPTSSDPPDDWVDGSWTVDCVCGVNFDDGEEMVNCDECGVWVHTRCSRYVKSEKSFACDKCKSKNTRNDSEETEVAQLLVELPTKTLKMDNPYRPGGGPPRRPFRLWTDIPIEERVHVQGIPGGEPALFGGLSSVFTPELWKCTGYVPKKFNFQYREFPCWDKEQEVNAKSEGGNENPDDKGAGVLFSLSKESAHSTFVATVSGMKRQLEDGGCDNMAPSKDMKNRAGENMDEKCAQNVDKKDRTLLRPIVIHAGKHKREESGPTKDQSGKKKVRVVNREGDPKKRALHPSKTASTLSSDAKQLEFCEDGGPKTVKGDTQSINNRDLSDTLLKYPTLGGHRVVENNVDMPKDNVASSDCLSEAKAFEASRHKLSIGARTMEVNGSHHVLTRTGNSPNTDVGMASLLEYSDLGTVPIKEEVAATVLDNVNNNGGGSSTSAGIDCHKSELRVEDSIAVVANVKDDRSCQDPNIAVCPSSLEPGAKVKKEADTDNSGGTSNVESSTNEIVKSEGAKPLTQHSGTSVFHLSANAKMIDTVVISPQSSSLKVLGVDKSTGVISNCQTDTSNEFSNVLCQPKQVEGSDDSNAAGKSSPELKHESRVAEEQSKLSSTIVVPPAPPCQHRMAASSSASSAIVTSKPSVSDKFKPSNLQNSNPNVKQGMSDLRFAAKKESNSIKTVRCEDRREMARKISKESSKCSVSSVLKASRSSKSSHSSDYKKTVSDSKDGVLYPSSKSPSASSAQNIAVTPRSSDLASSTHAQIASHVHNKISAAGLPQRGEKVNLSNSQSSTKVNHTAPMHPPAPSNLPAILSDEELALLLHQELNSSPRVPRVPRMRHTGSLPQLGSPTATSMLIKRTSGSGGRDHSAALKRKNKDLPKDGSRSSREIDEEAQMDRLPTSPDCRRHNSASTVDAFTKREVDSGPGKGVQAVKKSKPSVSTTTVTLSTVPYTLAEATEQNLSSMRNSPQNASDNDTGTVRGPIHRTLPGLIAEIMSKGERMTYEELCNAVLPHWPNLRKHNGERYAYSSHSQAVLDCLRNRYEWAQLVDRGPKTNAGRKRRKPDAEVPSFESEDSEDGKDTTAKEVEGKSFETHREEFPKGKRKARKRRRLALQGRGIKDVRRRRRADVISDDDDDSFSSSSEESMFSDDEIQGGGAGPVGSEASTSSDETGTMS